MRSTQYESTKILAGLLQFGSVGSFDCKNPTVRFVSVPLSDSESTKELHGWFRSLPAPTAEDKIRENVAPRESGEQQCSIQYDMSGV